jgi:DNA-binding NarL/FixJ family response regulator
MDIRMPKVDGISATARVRRRSSPPEILVLTTFDTDDHVVRALRAGASGFLLKDTAPTKIVAAIHAVANGEPAMSPGVMRRLMDRVAVEAGQHQRARARLAAFSDRETEVVRAVASGLSNAEIAAALFMSVATVKAHVGSILSKLGLTTARRSLCWPMMPGWADTKVEVPDWAARLLGFGLARLTRLVADCCSTQASVPASPPR